MTTSDHRASSPHLRISDPTIVSCIARHASDRPHDVWIRVELPQEQFEITFGQAWSEILAYATRLTQLDLPRAGVIFFFLPQSWHGIACYFGAMAAGYIPSFMPCPSSKQDPRRYWEAHLTLVDRIQPVAIVTDASYAKDMGDYGLLRDGVRLVVVDHQTPQNIEKLRTLPQAHDIALLQHSSGTTGLKKGVMLSHHAILKQVEAYASVLNLRAETDVVVSWLPLYHDMGLIACLMLPAIYGVTLVLLDPFYWVSRPASLLHMIKKHRGTLCWLPNFSFDLLTNVVQPDPDELDLSTMRAFVNCSETCHVATFTRFLTHFSPVGLRPEMLQVCYAMAETTFAVTQTDLAAPPKIINANRQTFQMSGLVDESVTDHNEVISFLSNGRPVPSAAVAVMSPEGAPLPDNQVGEIYVRADFLFEGYYRLAAETEARLANGVYRTRDRGFTRDGELFVLGRLDDLLILNGRNFHASEIEAIVTQVSGVRAGRNVALGIHNPQKGTNDLVILAEIDDIALGNSKSVAKAIRQEIFQQLGMYPTEIHVVDSGWLVKTTSGKLSRSDNMKKYLEFKSQF
jgi:fatty-acyl-CoA synthase